MSSPGRGICLVAVLLFLALGAVGAPSALSLTPSSNWYGDDGVWSGVSLRIGTPPQWTDVLVSTGSSETWVVSPNGCDGTNQCTSRRGGLFDWSQSTTWKSEGFYELGLDVYLDFNGTGDYGLDTIEFGDTGMSLNESIIASINTTEYLTGFFGLGVIPGNFSDGQFKSPLAALVETANLIPSHSYGFTAGATYQQKGETCSVTLGGYDANRFVPHNVSFTLNPIQQPETFLNAIVISSASGQTNWTSNSQQVLAPASGIYVVIDSSTPFLWFPQSICDEIAKTLGLTYNDTLQLYTFDGNASRHDDIRTWDLNFAFTFSDTTSPSNIVNITVPYAAFDLQLTYPYIANTTAQSSDATKNYFPMRRATTEDQYTIGRAFLQEAYLITDYERNNFSIHQAVHVADPIGNTSIVDITRPTSSKLTGPPATSQSSSSQPELETAAVAGIAVGGVAIVTIAVLLAIFLCRRRRNQQNKDAQGEPREFGSASPRLRRILPSRWFGRRSTRPHSSDPTIFSEMDSASQPRFELPDNQVPVELESEPSTHVGTQDSYNMAAYERARRKNEELMRATEKSDQDIAVHGTHRPYEEPVMSPVWSNDTGSTLSPNTSPVSPDVPDYTPYPLYPYREEFTSVYMGRMPPLVNVPKLVGPDGTTLSVEGSTIDSLGSGFTVDEEERMKTLEAGPSLNAEGMAVTQQTEDLEMVHIPVPAEHRFSWEGPDRESGTMISNRIEGAPRYI